MTRYLILPLLALALAGCRTESADDAPEASPPADASADLDVASGGLPYIAPRRTGDAEQTTRTANLREVTLNGEECYVIGSDAEGDLLLMGTREACEQGAALAGRVVTITQEPAFLDVPVGDETVEQEVLLVTGIEPVE